MILFARHIEMPPSWVGALISFMPLASLLVIFTIQIVSALGPKRAMFMAWLLRNIVISVVFTMPWVIDRYSLQMGWYVLLFATLGFCMFRALGAGAWFPWLHEVVPENKRGIFFSTESALIQFSTVWVIILQGLILRRDPGIAHFLTIYGIGITAGLASLILMWRIPGGAGVPQKFSVRGLLDSYRHALADGVYLRFIGVITLGFFSIASYGAALVMYLRDMLHLPERTIMTMLAGGAMAVFLTVRYWGRFAEHSGSGRAMCKALIAQSLVIATFLLHQPAHSWTPYFVAPAIALVVIFNQAFWVSAHRAMLNFVREEGRIGYTNLWTIGSAIALGGTPNLVGWIIEWGGLTGFRICFLMATCGGLLTAIFSARIVRDGVPVQPSLTQMLNPALPVRTLARIAWITLGMHESNRPEPPQ